MPLYQVVELYCHTVSFPSPWGPALAAHVFTRAIGPAEAGPYEPPGPITVVFARR
jgi:hypothetical protein